MSSKRVNFPSPPLASRKRTCPRDSKLLHNLACVISETNAFPTITQAPLSQLTEIPIQLKDHPKAPIVRDVKATEHEGRIKSRTTSLRRLLVAKEKSSLEPPSAFTPTRSRFPVGIEIGLGRKNNPPYRSCIVAHICIVGHVAFTAAFRTIKNALAAGRVDGSVGGKASRRCAVAFRTRRPAENRPGCNLIRLRFALVFQ